jgi:4-amino-4-deoxy-L-arabinose transferase-like glycosyltransferase
MSAKTPNVMSWAQARGVVGRVFCTVCRDTDRVSILHKHYYILLAAIVSLAFAFNLSNGRGYSTPAGQLTAHRPPGTSLSLLPVYVIFGRSFFWGRLWLCFLSAATCLAVAWLGRVCYGPVVSVLAAAWCAVYPGHFYYAQHYVSEVPFGLWITLACGFTVRAFSSEKNFATADIAAACCWALAILTRPQAILAVPVAWLCVLLFSSLKKRRQMVHLTAQTCLLIIFIAPWVVRNSAVLGKPTLSTVGGYTFWGAHNDVVFRNPQLQGSWIPTSGLVDTGHALRGDEIDKETVAWRYGFESIVQNLDQMPHLIIMKLWRTISPIVDTPNTAVRIAFGVGWLMTVPFVLGGVVLAVRDKRITTLVLLTPLIVTLVTTIIFYGSDRFRDSIAPIFLVLAAQAAVEWVRALARCIYQMAVPVG